MENIKRDADKLQAPLSADQARVQAGFENDLPATLADLKKFQPTQKARFDRKLYKPS